MYPRLQTTILLFIACMFGVGSLIQIAEQPVYPQLDISYRHLKKPEQIIQVQQPVDPIAYTSVVSLANLPVAEKKQRFTSLLLPAILITKQQQQQQRQKIAELLARTNHSIAEQTWLKQAQQRYRADTPEQLLERITEIPNSMILAQAAIETGWGSSRFFIQANNIFGVWSFNPEEPRIKARQGRNGKAVYLKRYPSLLGAVDDYLVTLGRNDHYKGLRKASKHSQDSLQLISHLGAYSELGDQYIQRLAAVIRHNQLQQYDHYTLSKN